MGSKQGRARRLREWADNQSLGGDLTPRWRLHQFDPGFTLADGFMTVDQLRGLVDTLARFELMTWDEIVAMGPARNCHGVKPQSRPEIMDRLAERDIDPEEAILFQLPGEGEARVFGIRQMEEFSILWWDPEHQVFPRDGDKKGK